MPDRAESLSHKPEESLGMERQREWESAFAEVDRIASQKAFRMGNQQLQADVPLVEELPVPEEARFREMPLFTDSMAQSTRRKQAESLESAPPSHTSEKEEVEFATPEHLHQGTEKTALSRESKSQPVHLLQQAITDVNNSNLNFAYQNLAEYLTFTHPQLVVNSKTTSQEQKLNSLIQTYIDIALLHPTGPSLDPHIQIALGILFFSVAEYQKASDCFCSAISFLSSPSSAVSVAEARRAEDIQVEMWRLWNCYATCMGRLGKKMEKEAVRAYEEALRLKPGCRKVRYNIAITHLKSGRYREVVGMLLDLLPARSQGVAPAVGKQSKREGLRMVRVGSSHGMFEEVPHESEARRAEFEKVVETDDDDKDDVSDSEVYDLLRRALTGMCRWDLAVEVVLEIDVEWLVRELEC